MKARTILFLVVALALCICVSATASDADLVPASGIADRSAFNQASFAGIHLNPPLTTGTLGYTLSIDPGATITLDSKTYKVNWIQSFVIFGKTANTTFTATEGAPCGWTWNPGINIAGWGGNGSGRIDVGQGKQFHFGTLTIPANSVEYGFHLGFQDGNNEKTGWYHGDIPSVPEPSSLAGLIAVLPAVGFGLKKRSR